MWKNNMQAIANIGSLTRPKYVKMPTLDLAGAIDDYYNSKDAAVARVDAEAEKQRRQAMVDEMTAQHPEAAAQIAADPMGYAKMLEEREKAERDQQFKMDMLNRQFSNSMALADRQHANSVGLAKMRDELQNQAAANAKAQRAAELEEALNSGMITKEQYNLAKQRDLLGDIASGRGGGVAANGLELTGNKAYDDKRQKQYADDLDKYETMKANMPQIIQMAENLNDLADKTSTSWWSKGKALAAKGLGGFSTETDDANIAYDNMVNNALLPLLRQTFGAQFTEREGEKLLATLGNRSMTPAQRKTALNTFVTQKQREIESLGRKLDSYKPPIQTVKGNITYSGKKINGGKDWSQVSNEDLMKGL